MLFPKTKENTMTTAEKPRWPAKRDQIRRVEYHEE
jgi:hypothetical protein